LDLLGAEVGTLEAPFCVGAARFLGVDGLDCWFDTGTLRAEDAAVLLAFFPFGGIVTMRVYLTRYERMDEDFERAISYIYKIG
jgi:hypothetical protein